MGMFIVKKGVTGKVIKQGKEWNVAANIKDHVVKKDQVFEKHELCIDPTGISKYACGPNNVKTIGSAYAAAGWYGFERDGWYLLVREKDVEYA